VYLEYNEELNDYICHSGKELIKATYVQPQTDYTLHLTFSTGESKVYDMKPLLDEGVFSQLKNKALFMAAKLDGISVVWTDDIDIDPTELYVNGVPIAPNA
jgi:hypothetical protein